MTMKSPASLTITTTVPPAPADTAARIGPAALVTARWALLAVALGLALTALWWPQLWGGVLLGGALAPLGTVLVWGLVNLRAARGARGPEPDAEGRAAGLHLLLDVSLLTTLLALTGAANNPFTMLYFVPMMLATLVSRSWTWLVALASVLGFSVLVGVSAWTTQVEIKETHAEHRHHHVSHDLEEQGSGDHFWRHLVGMGVALAVAGSLVTYFVHQIAGALSAQRGELERLRRQAHEDRYVASLGALSAGAAHELGTPLGTIGLLTEELEWMEEQERKQAALLIRAELERCKDILHGMKNPELSARALENETPWQLLDLTGVLGALEVPSGVELAVRIEGPVAGVFRQPRVVLEQTISELVKNASRAAASDRPLQVEVVLSSPGDDLCISVRDDGVGMQAEELARAFEPFFSGRAHGRGLGLFLARLHARQLGGDLSLSSEPGQGTSVELRLPRRPPGGHPSGQSMAARGGAA